MAKYIAWTTIEFPIIVEADHETDAERAVNEDVHLEAKLHRMIDEGNFDISDILVEEENE